MVREIDCAIRARLESALERATAILEVNRAPLERASRRLLDDETLEGEALDLLLVDARGMEQTGQRAFA